MMQYFWICSTCWQIQIFKTNVILSRAQASELKLSLRLGSALSQLVALGEFPYQKMEIETTLEVGFQHEMINAYNDL